MDFQQFKTKGDVFYERFLQYDEESAIQFVSKYTFRCIANNIGSNKIWQLRNILWEEQHIPEPNIKPELMFMAEINYLRWVE